MDSLWYACVHERVLPCSFFTACSHHKNLKSSCSVPTSSYPHTHTHTLTCSDEAVFSGRREESYRPDRQAVRASFSALTSQRENIGISTISSLITGSSLPNWSFKVQLTMRLAQQKIEETQRLAECFFLHILTNPQHSAPPTFHLHSGRKTIYLTHFLQTTGLWDVRRRHDCFILISCGCNKPFLKTTHRFLFMRRKMRMRRRSVRRQKRKWLCPRPKIAFIPSCSLYSTRTACHRERLDLYKPMIMTLGLIFVYTCTQESDRHHKILLPWKI